MATNIVEAPVAAEASERPVSPELWHELSQTLYREARLFAGELYRDWIATLVHPDIHYQVAERQTRMRRDRYAGSEVVYSWNDRLSDIEMRIRALESGMQWSANPIETVRHNFSNIEAFHGEHDGQYAVLANVWVVRNRRVHDEMTYSYGRRDIWERQDDGRLLLRHRLCSVDERYLRGKNLAFFL